MKALGSGTLVALDVDGTLIDHDERMTDRVRAAVAAVRDTAAHVVVATGRGVVGTVPVLDRLSLTHGFAVCSNGAVTIRLDPALDTGWETEHVITFDPGPALRLLRDHLPGALFAIEEVGEGFRLSGPFPEGELSGTINVVDFEALVDGPATRVIVRSPAHTPEDFLALIEQVGLHGVSYAVGWTAWLDLAPEGVSKATALERLRGRLGVHRDATIAVGDGRNDVEMLRWAARGVAMGQAVDAVQEAADEVTAAIEDDGAALVLEGLVRAGRRAG